MTGSFLVASVGAGTYTITAIGSPADDGASVSFTIGSSAGLSMALSPTSGAAGSTVQVSVSDLSTSDTSCSLTGTAIASQSCSVSDRILTGSFVVADVVAGSYTITATGSPTGDSASGTFTVSGATSLTFNPSSAGVGSTVDFSGSALSTSDTSCSLSGTVIASQTCSISGGTYTGTFIVSNVAAGSYVVAVTGSPEYDSASASFTVSTGSLAIVLNPVSAAVGSTVQVSSTGFSTSDTSCSLSGTPIASQTCSISSGALTGSFDVANVTVGSYTITATGSPTGDSASATFGLSGPSVTLNPVSAVVGAIVQVSGSGFSSTDTTCSLSGSPVSNSTCSISGGTITGQFTVANVTVGSYTVISTGSPVGDSASATFVVTASTANTPNFSVTTSSSIITLTQGGSGSATITVNSLNGFSSAVTLTPSWIGNAPAGASFAITSPITPVAGGVATSVLTITAASSASTGPFAIQVTGMSGSLTQTLTPNLVVQITPAVTTTTSTSSSVVNSTSTTSSASSTISALPLPTNCPVSYAMSGSELAPIAQRLRVFRDESIMKTLPGRAFMMLFNSWYYSFSPHVASYVTTHQAQRMLLKDAMYPLIAVLYASYYAYLLMSPLSSDLGVMLAGVIATLLLGLIYLAPIGYVTKRILRRYLQHSLLRRSHMILWAGVSVLLIPLAYFTNSLLMGIIVANLLISMLSIGCVLGATALGRLRIGNVVFGVPVLIRRFVNMPTWNRNLNTTKT